MKISAKGVTKKFGSTLALDSVTLDFAGHVNLILGSNGSGKSTLINVIAGVTYPQEGTLLLDGVELHSRDRMSWRKGIETARVKMGVVLDKPGYPTYLEGEEFLRWASSAEDRAWTEGLTQRLDMAGFVHKSIGGYSSGMTQRIGLASSVVSRPEMVLWDEPTANLDAPARKIVAGLIRELVEKGTSFIIASHTPADFEDVADWMCVMRLGQVVKSGMIEDLSAGSARFVVESDQPSAIASEALRVGLATKAEVRDGNSELETSGKVEIEAIRRIANNVHAEVRSIDIKPRSVSELYAEAIA